MVSRDFKIAVKLAEMPAWRIAYQAGINPNVLSKIISGALRVRNGDWRVLKIGAVVGLKPEECFTQEEFQEVKTEG